MHMMSRDFKTITVWSVHEQVVVAALDIGDIKRAEVI